MPKLFISKHLWHYNGPYEAISTITWTHMAEPFILKTWELQKKSKCFAQYLYTDTLWRKIFMTCYFKSLHKLCCYLATWVLQMIGKKSRKCNINFLSPYGKIYLNHMLCALCWVQKVSSNSDSLIFYQPAYLWVFKWQGFEQNCTTNIVVILTA